MSPWHMRNTLKEVCLYNELFVSLSLCEGSLGISWVPMDSFVCCAVQVAYVCCRGPSSSPVFPLDNIWAEAMRQLDMEIPDGAKAYNVLTNPSKSQAGVEDVVLVFDEVTALLGHPGALKAFLQEIRTMQSNRDRHRCKPVLQAPQSTFEALS